MFVNKKVPGQSRLGTFLYLIRFAYFPKIVSQLRESRNSEMLFGGEGGN